LFVLFNLAAIIIYSTFLVGYTQKMVDWIHGMFNYKWWYVYALSQYFVVLQDCLSQSHIHIEYFNGNLITRPLKCMPLI
jgi:hypothetical protein